MSKIKEWAQSHKTELKIIGYAAAGATIAVVGVVVASKLNGANPVAISLDPSKAPKGFEDHDYAGLLSGGPDGSLWAHPDTNGGANKPFKVGHADFENRVMYYTEYPHEGPCPELLETQPPANA